MTTTRYRIAPDGRPLTSAEFFSALFADVPAEGAGPFAVTVWQCPHDGCRVDDLRVRAAWLTPRAALVCPLCRGALECIGAMRTLTLLPEPEEPAP